MKKDQNLTVEIELSRLVSDELQTRDGLRNTAVAEYAKVLQDGEALDPAIVFNVDGEYFLASGFHRREAYRQAGRDVMTCIVKEGTLWDAVEYGIRDNLKHQGERVTQADKARAVRKVLKVKPELSDRGIAELCGLSPTTVAKYRAELESTVQIGQLSERTGLDGKLRRVPVTPAVRSPTSPSASGPLVQEVSSESGCPGRSGSDDGQPRETSESREPGGQVVCQGESELEISRPTVAPPAPASSASKPESSFIETLRMCLKRLGYLAREVNGLRRPAYREYMQARGHIEALSRIIEVLGGPDIHPIKSVA